MLNYHKLIDPDPDPGSARPHCWDPPSDGCVKLTDFWGVYIYSPIIYHYWHIIQIILGNYISYRIIGAWVHNHHNSLAWQVGPVMGMIPCNLTMIPVRSQWGHYNLLIYVCIYVHLWGIYVGFRPIYSNQPKMGHISVPYQIYSGIHGFSGWIIMIHQTELRSFGDSYFCWLSSQWCRTGFMRIFPNMHIICMYIYIYVHMWYRFQTCYMYMHICDVFFL